MIEKDILTMAKVYQLKIEMSHEKMRMLIASRKYATTIIDVSKKNECEIQIKALDDYIKTLNKAYDKFRQNIDNFAYVLSNVKERVVLREYILEGKSAKEIMAKYPRLNYTEKSIYNIACEIKKELNKIKIDKVDIL